MRRAILLAALLALLVCWLSPAFATVDETWLSYWNPFTKKYQTLTKGAFYAPSRWSTSSTAPSGTIDAAGVNDTRMSWCDDFMEAAAALGSTVYSKAHWTGGGTNGTQTITAGANGTMVLDTAATQNNTSTLTFSTANFAIANNPTLELRLKLGSTITFMILDAGWYVDGNDEALFRFSTAVDASNLYFVYENNNGGEQSADTNYDVLASTYVTLRIQLLSTGAARAWVNGVLRKNYPASTIRSVAFVPYIYIKTVAASSPSRTVTIDYVKIWQDR